VYWPLPLLVVLAAGPAGANQGSGLARFEAQAKPVAANHARLGKRIVQVTNQTLPAFVDQTKTGYLEVVVPAQKGHVYFRHGTRVFDFYQGGFRISDVRPIGKARYGFLIPLEAAHERALERYLDRLTATGGRELGTYDYYGSTGFHCVTWLNRLKFPGKQRLTELLGGEEDDGESMPRFARFVMKSAKPVEGLVLYQDAPVTPEALAKTRFRVITSRQLSRAHSALSN